MKVTISFEIDSNDFDYAAGFVQQVAKKIARGRNEGKVMNENGNSVGTFSVDDVDDDNDID